MTKFIDQVEITIRSGHGGAGSATFRREKFIPMGGPNGGDGGRGGDVILEASRNLRTLYDFTGQSRYTAEDGQPGQSKEMFGKDAKDLIILVPCGTAITDIDSGTLIADLKNHGDKVIASKGGKGGLGNVHFATSIRQAPTYAQKGLAGEEHHVRLELKLIADVGLVGLPNAGKSTLLSRLSNAKPKIADYPFTTLHPNLGVCRLFGEREIIIADIPGLIEGAHRGVGLGHDFLRHLERTRLLVHLLDVALLDDTDPYVNYKTINKELRKYSKTLGDKKQIVALNKVDALADRQHVAVLEEKLISDGVQVVQISGVSGEGLEELRKLLGKEIVESDQSLK